MTENRFGPGRLNCIVRVTVPFFIQNGENGFVYSNKQEFCELIEQLLNNESLRIMASEKAYRTILESWNPQVAAKRLLALFESITSFGNCNLFANGPCSKCYEIHLWSKKKKSG